MKFFLQLKHWQLFGLLVGIPFILQIVGMVTKSVIILTVSALIMFGVLFGWYYTLGINLNKKLPKRVKMNVTKFNWSMFITLVSQFFFFVFIPNRSFRIQPTFVVFLLCFFLMFCFLYCLYFNAKSLKSIELQKNAVYGDYAGVLFSLALYPVGVWIIQPRINKIFNENLSHRR